MAHGAFHAVGAMRAGFPLVIDRLVAGGSGTPGWNQPMEHMLGLILLSHGRLDGSSRKKKNEQGGTEHTSAEPVHEMLLHSPALQYQTGDACGSVMEITFTA